MRCSGLYGNIERVAEMTTPLERVVTEGRQTEDQLMRDVLASTTSFINCVSGFNADNPTEITRTDIDLVVRTLRGNNAYSFLSGVEGENKFGTAPVRDAYFALGHTDLIGQVDACSGFISKWSYKLCSLKTVDNYQGSLKAA
jgi:N4-gp56 family major capsid protein